MTYDKIKAPEKSGLQPHSKIYFSGKIKKWVAQIYPTILLRVKLTCFNFFSLIKKYCHFKNFHSKETKQTTQSSLFSRGDNILKMEHQKIDECLR